MIETDWALLSKCYLVAGAPGATRGNYATHMQAGDVRRGPNSARDRQSQRNYFRPQSRCERDDVPHAIELAQKRLRRRLRAILLGTFVPADYLRRK